MPNTLLAHPTNGTYSFGTVPTKTVRGVTVPSGSIVLKAGKHSERGGYGAAHIWARHGAEMRSKGFAAIADVPSFVATIVQLGSPVFCEFNFIKNIRATVIRTATGVAILEYVDKSGTVHYSVVTAYTKGNAHGTRIGSVGV